MRLESLRTLSKRLSCSHNIKAFQSIRMCLNPVKQAFFVELKNKAYLDENLFCSEDTLGLILLSRQDQDASHYHSQKERG